MNKTKIEWCDYTINPVKGLCPMGCSYCYARAMYKRFKWNPEIRFVPECFDAFRHVYKFPQGIKIFIGSTIELFGDWISPEWMQSIMTWVRTFDEYIFIFLTKQPQNLIKWSPFPDNCWIGVSVTANGDMTNAYYGLEGIEAGARFLSIEPLLGRIGMNDHVNIQHWLDWLIIGSQTQPVKHPQREWVDEIINATDKARIPVFVKEPMASYFEIKRQEFPDLIRKGGE